VRVRARGVARVRERGGEGRGAPQRQVRGVPAVHGEQRRERVEAGVADRKGSGLVAARSESAIAQS
jgi:hypothetical protein